MKIVLGPALMLFLGMFIGGGDQPQFVQLQQDSAGTAGSDVEQLAEKSGGKQGGGVRLE